MEANISLTPKQQYKDYHFLSLFISVALICLTPFTTSYLAFIPFVIQLVRLVGCKPEVFLIDLACLLPFSNIFREPGGKSLYSVLILFACGFFAVTKKFKTSFSLALCVALFCYLLTRSVSNFITSLPALSGVLIIYIASVFINRENAVLMSKVNIVSVLFASVFGFIFKDTSALINYTRDPAAAHYGSNAIRFKGLFTDPNYYASCIIIAIVLIIILYIIKEIKITSFVVGFLGLTIFGFITYSKSFLIVYIIACFFYLAVSVKRKRFLIFFIVSALFLFILFNLASDKIEFFAVMRERFGESDNLNELTSGRANAWENYLGYIFSNAKTMLFGDTLDAPLIDRIGTHNLVIELLYYTGIVGLILFVGFLGAVIHDVMASNLPIKNERKGLMKYGLIIVFVVMYMSLQAIFASSMYVQWILVFTGIIIGNIVSNKEIENEGPGNIL